MVTRADIQRLAGEIATSFPDVERILLFGSYAYGTPTSDSDVDLLVVMPHQGAGYRAASRIRAAIDPDFPVDLIVRSPDEMERRLADGDTFICDVTKRGTLLHENQHARMDRESGGRSRRRGGASSVA